jgi:hypothetical protein
LLSIHHSLGLGAGPDTRRAESAPTSDLRFFRVASLRAVVLSCAVSVVADTDRKLACSNGLRLLRTRNEFCMCRLPAPARYARVFEADLEHLRVEGEQIAVLSLPPPPRRLRTWGEP